MNNPERKKTVGQAFREILSGYDLFGNLKFLLFGLLGLSGYKQEEDRLKKE